ncbi:dihydroflavonol-4-reductase [Tranquillimonas rosea]|uniref:Dihydroflavonol-4-reductase n=1 Tax=Tranquillimonas rosea TaxID=641238 RepID=A0A1H9U4I3_9RHOB|nr:aldehyde reductase [Tranquillimonas rosea]SES04232.1 dihydroflavonol-4-reductase [Tranquillimonas rosea]
MAHSVLVTGATGFIAKHIVLKLLDRGHTVVASARSKRREGELRAALGPNLTDQNALERLHVVALDLDKDEGWDAAMQDVDVLIHTASPFPMAQPEEESLVVRPAVDGTLRALGAAHRAGVKRTILTSSSVAVMNTSLSDGRPAYDETDWSDTDDPRATPYVKSKTLAERAAWDFVETEAAEMQLTTINPALVVGAPLDGNFGTSVQLIQRILNHQDPIQPPLGFPCVDVRDVAEMHVRAMERVETAGRRYIAAAEFLWLREMAEQLKATFPDRKIATREAPSWLVRILARVDRTIAAVAPNLDRRDEVSNARARDEMGMTFADPRESVVACARFLIENGLVK